MSVDILEKFELIRAHLTQHFPGFCKVFIRAINLNDIDYYPGLVTTIDYFIEHQINPRDSEPLTIKQWLEKYHSDITLSKTQYKEFASLSSTSHALCCGSLPMKNKEDYTYESIKFPLLDNALFTALSLPNF